MTTTKKSAKLKQPAAPPLDMSERVFGLMQDFSHLGMPLAECGPVGALAWPLRKTTPLDAHQLLGYGTAHACKDARGVFFAHDGARRDVFIVTDMHLTARCEEHAACWIANFLPSYTAGLEAARRVRWLPILGLSTLPILLVGELALAIQDEDAVLPLILFYARNPENRAKLDLAFVHDLGEKLFEFCALDMTGNGEGVAA
jgi:hypothetical protein